MSSSNNNTTTTTIQQKPFSLPIVIIGKESSGKTTLINNIVGFNIGHTAITQATSNVIYIHCKVDVSRVEPLVMVGKRALSYPFANHMQQLMGEDIVSRQPMVLTVYWKQFSNDFSLIDCPGYKDDQAQNSVINSLIKNVINIPCILLYCFSVSTYGANIFNSLQLLDWKSNKVNILPVVTKVDAISNKDLVQVLRVKELACISLERIVVTRAFLYDDNDDLRKEVQSFSNGLKQNQDYWKEYEIKFQQYVKTLTPPISMNISFGIDSLRKTCQHICERHDKMKMDDLRRELSVLKNSHNEKKQLSKANIIDGASSTNFMNSTIMIITTLKFLLDPDREQRNYYNSNYGQTLDEEMKSLSDTSILSLKNMCPDLNNSKLTGIDQLNRDSHWIDAIISCMPRIEFNISPNEPSFKKKRGAIIVNPLLEEDENVIKQAKNREYFIQVFKSIEEFHSSKLQVIFLETMRSSIVECNLTGSGIAREYSRYYANILQKYISSNNEEFFSFLQCQFLEGDIENDISHIKTYMRQQGFKILNKLKNIDTVQFITSGIAKCMQAYNKDAVDNHNIELDSIQAKINSIQDLLHSYDSRVNGNREQDSNTSTNEDDDLDTTMSNAENDIEEEAEY